MSEVNQHGQAGAIADVIVDIATRANEELLSLTEDELRDRWYFVWDDDSSLDWNVYRFCVELGRYTRQCRRWEEAHGGSCCVVERVRDEYLMPRVNAFRAELLAKQFQT